MLLSNGLAIPVTARHKVLGIYRNCVHPLVFGVIFLSIIATADIVLAPLTPQKL